MVDKIVVITGANRGIGYALSDELSGMGCTVIMVCRKKETGEPAFQKLQNLGRKVVLKIADVSNADQITALGKEVEAEFSHIDVLINNAAVNIDPENQGIENIDLDILETTLQTNVIGPVWMCRTFIPLLKKSKDGRIINFSSGLGQLTVPRMGPFPAYSISKTAINALTKLADDELKDDNIMVVSLDPGWVKTDMGGPNAEMTIEEAIVTPVWLATGYRSEITSGEFYKEKKILGW